MLNGRTPNTECAVLLEKQSCFFVLFSFVSLKIKVKRDVSRKVRTEVDLKI